MAEDFIVQLYNMPSIALGAFGVGCVMVALTCLAMFRGSELLYSTHSAARLVGLMMAGLGLMFGSILTRSMNSALERYATNFSLPPVPTPWWALGILGACTAYLLWLVFSTIVLREPRNLATILLCSALLAVSFGVLSETLIFFDEDWALGLALSWAASPVLTIALIRNLVKTRLAVRRMQRSISGIPSLSLRA